MARRVLGKITSRVDNTSLEGYRVDIYDHDEFDDDDFMGRGFTNANGEYNITYEGGKWDPSPFKEWTWWRPDIYIQVYAPIGNTDRWIKVWQSGIQGNWRLREDLVVNAVVTPPSSLARTISGVIYWSNDSWPGVGTPGGPAQGVRVQAYDKDLGWFLDKDDYMGVATTDEQGRYRIEYSGSRWDLGSGGSWRPDIYIRVHYRYGEKWEKVHQSVVFTDVKHEEGLIYDAVAYFPNPDSEGSTPVVIEGTYWEILNGNRDLRIRIQFPDTERRINIRPGNVYRVFIRRNQRLNFWVETEINNAWLYRTEHTLSGGSDPGIRYETYRIGIN